MKKYKVLVLFLLFVGILLSQEQSSFKRHKEFYLNGDATVIGNNILNKDATRAFNNSRVQNNEVKMTYVDIDKDNTTFSSSSSLLNLPNNIQEIAYAGLYWSGTYSCVEGKKKRVKRDYVFEKVDGQRSENFNQIKFKTPGSSYKAINGKVIYDGYKSKKHSESAPYVCYADVTKHIVNAKKKNGLYTVANVRASLGFIPGGSSAGWMLYVVYKSPTKYPKYIATYSGFKYVENNKPVSIQFKNHESTAEVEKIKTSLVIAALEGDATLNRDECAIYNPRKGIYLPLSIGYRRRDNFFTSTISTSSVKSIDRNPGSRNTLGYDLVELDLKATKEETIIKKNKNTILRFKTDSDEFFVFFTAFKTEIQQELNVNGDSPDNALATIDNSKGSTLEENEETASKTIAEPKKNKGTKLKPTIVSKSTTSSINEGMFDKIQAEESTIITDIRSGYYVISNIVTSEKSAQNWMKELTRAGFKAKRFKKPYEKSRYVYTFVSEDLKKALEELLALKKHPKFKEASILKVNME